VAANEVYIDIDRAQVVGGVRSNDPVLLPRFVQGDNLPLRIHLLQNFDRSTGYDEISTDGITLQVALRSGKFSGSASFGDIVAAQYTWTPNEDLYFEASLSLATTEINTLLTSAKTFDATFIVQKMGDATPHTILQQEVRVYKNLIDSESTLPVPTPTYLTAEAALAMFVKLMDEERPQYRLNATTGVRTKIWTDTDGTYRGDPVI
jgi:hypothetical protein